MYTAFELGLSGVGLSLLACLFGLRFGRAMFLSVGMLMLFNAWLELINFDSSWPADQPPDRAYLASKAEVARLDEIAYAAPWPKSQSDWDDYRRCLKLNVCVRLFARQ